MNIKFSSHEKSKYWSKQNLDGPEEYALNSHKKCWFDCNTCGHCFKKMLKDINLTDGWCQYCVSKKLCDSEECMTCYNKSFASVEFSKYWSDKNKIKPRQLLKNSHKIY